MVQIDKVLKALCDPGIYQKLELLVFSIGKKKNVKNVAQFLVKKAKFVSGN